MTLVIDDRESRSFNKIKNRLPKGFPEYQIKRLLIGDYLLDNEKTLLLERKNISDLLSTWYELRSRFYRMKKEDTDLIGLVIEGSPSVKGGMVLQWRGSKGMVKVMSYATYQKFLLREQSEGTMMFHTDNLEQTMMLIGALHDYLPEIDKPRAIGCKAANLLTLIPGVGEKKAEEISKRYASPIDALKNIEDWLPSSEKLKYNKW